LILGTGHGHRADQPREVLRGVFLYLGGRRARDPKEQRRAEQLEHRLQVDEHGRKCGTGGRRTASWIVRMRKSAIVTATDLPPRPAQLFAVTQKRMS
jgi:hypothetical protein